MFSKANRRFTAVLVVICAVGLHGLTKVASLAEHDKNAATVWGVITFLIVQLLAILRAVMSDNDALRERESIKRTVEDVAAKADKIEEKTNGNLTRAINVVAEKVQQANDRPSPAQRSMPATVDELSAFVETVGQRLAPKLAEQICDDIAVKAARVAAEAVRDTERSQVVGIPCEHDNPADAIFCATCGRRLRVPATP